MKNVLKRFFPVLICVLLLIASFVPVSAADFSQDADSVSYYYSIWPLDSITYYGPVGSNWLVNAPYPGTVRFNPDEFITESSGYYSSQYTFAVGATRSRVNYLYSGVASRPDLPFGSYEAIYDLSNGNSAVPVTPIWSKLDLTCAQTILPASVLQQEYNSGVIPYLHLSWPSNVSANFEADDTVDVHWYYVVSYYTEIETSAGSEYYLDYEIVDQSLSYQMSGRNGLELDIPYLLSSPSSVQALNPNTKVSVEDFHLTVDWSDLSDENVYCALHDIIGPDHYTAINFMPWTNDRPVQPMDFWSWLTPALSGALDSPVIYGWSISDMLSVIFVIIFMIVLLKFFAGG